MALIHCPECNQSISDKASTCPHCGAPNTQQASAPIPPQTSQQASPVVEQGGTTCPFSGHPIPAGATVCVCGAYYGYKNAILTDRKFSLLVKLMGLCLLLGFVGYHADWDLAVLIGVLGTLVFGVSFFMALPIRLQGKKWWREF